VHPLDGVNLTELIELCREAGLGNFGRSTPREELIEALDSGVLPEPCPLDEQRVEMEKHISKNFRRLRTQLVSCNGKCTSFGCPDIIVVRCWEGYKGDIL